MWLIHLNHQLYTFIYMTTRPIELIFSNKKNHAVSTLSSTNTIAHVTLMLRPKVSQVAYIFQFRSLKDRGAVCVGQSLKSSAKSRHRRIEAA